MIPWYLQCLVRHDNYHYGLEKGIIIFELQKVYTVLYGKYVVLGNIWLNCNKRGKDQIKKRGAICV